MKPRRDATTLSQGGNSILLPFSNWMQSCLKKIDKFRVRRKPKGPFHTEQVVVADEQGNVAVVLHSCNYLLWGTTVLVDGISIPDAATFYQDAMERAGQGVRMPDTTNPVIVLKNGKLVLASMAISSALQEVMLQNLINVLDLGMDPQSAVYQPNFRGLFLGISVTGKWEPQPNEGVLDDGIQASIVEGLKQRGQEIYEGHNGSAQSGYLSIT